MKKDGRFVKGQKPWNYNKTGCFSKEALSKMSNSRLGRFYGSKSPKWKGGRITNSQGYILIFSPKHPNCDCYGYVREHRLIMEKHIGRYLKKKELVHHINEDKSDNRINNLKLFNSNSDHLRICHGDRYTPDETVRIIRIMHRDFNFNYSELSRIFNISFSCVRNIVTRKSHKNII